MNKTITVNGIDFSVRYFNATINVTSPQGDRIAFIQADDAVEQAFYVTFDEGGATTEYDEVAPRDIYDKLTNEDYDEVAQWLCAITF